MGKQINFYMNESVQNQFMEWLKKNEFQFVDYYSKPISQPENKEVLGAYLYKPEHGEILLHSDGRMDSIKSSVIEYSKTVVKEAEKKVLRGRLWIETQYYEQSGNIIKKPEQFLKEYQRLVRWIKKYVPYQEIAVGNSFIKEYINDEMKQLKESGFNLSI